MNRKELVGILNAAGMRPRRVLGQNFMVDEAALAAIVEAGALRGDEIVLEVGPGVGNLTRLLARAVPRGAVLAVDIDARLMAAAEAHHRDLANVTWLRADALARKHVVEPRMLEALEGLMRAHPESAVKLVANLPYNAASPLIAELLVESWRRRERADSGDGAPFLERMAFTVQWEVGLRMTAPPGTRHYGALGIVIQAMGGARIVKKIPPGAFWPVPKIDSALVVLTAQREKMAEIADAPALQALLAGLFAHRRQTLGNGLRHHLARRWHPAIKDELSAAGFDLRQRAEDLPVDDLLRLERQVTRLTAAGSGPWPATPPADS